MTIKEMLSDKRPWRLASMERWRIDCLRSDANFHGLYHLERRLRREYNRRAHCPVMVSLAVLNGEREGAGQWHH